MHNRFQVCLHMLGEKCDIYCISEFDLFFFEFFHLDLRAHDSHHHDFNFCSLICFFKDWFLCDFILEIFTWTYI